MRLAHKGGSMHGMSVWALFVQHSERTVEILSTTELNEDSILRKGEIKSTRAIGFSASLIADAALCTGVAMTLISEAAKFASSRATSTIARSGAFFGSGGVSLWGGSDGARS